MQTLYIFNGKFCCNEIKEAYLASYNFWQTNWLETLQKESLTTKPSNLSSDDFLRQDKVVCLFDNKTPIGIFFLEYMGFQAVALWVLEENFSARQFYKSLGFTLTSQTKIENLSADMLGAVNDEKITENATVEIREIRYYKKL